jgi:D-alanyl-D-alanine carboxypeptidase
MKPYNILVNKQNLLPPDYIPNDLTALDLPFDAPPNDPKRLMRKEAAQYAKLLFQASTDVGLKLYGISAYRSYARQKEIYDSSILDQGEEHTKKYIAPAGASEHQTGLALDVSIPSLNLDLVTEFQNTPEGLWLSRNAHFYGFIIRYPKEKEAITGFSYEPWHIRYVSLPLSSYLSIRGLTLEEYLQVDI